MAVHADRVIWYNDIEDGFNVSRFEIQGRIPDDEYWCNQDPLRWALAGLEASLAQSSDRQSQFQANGSFLQQAAAADGLWRRLSGTTVDGKEFSHVGRFANSCERQRNSTSRVL